MKKFIKEHTPHRLLKLLYKIYKFLIFRKSPKITIPPPNTDSVPCVIAYNKYGGYCLPINSIQRPALQVTLRGKVWEEETLNFLCSNLENGDIVHAGTYFGDFLPALSKACSKNSLVWAFEPNYENFLCAKMTVYINKLSNVKLTNTGLGEKNQTALMNTSDKKGRGMGGSSTILENNNNFEERQLEEVNITSLDSFIPLDRNISILQLDVEGYEKHALSGGIEVIKRCKPILVIEALPNEAWMKKNIYELGYEKVSVVQGNIILSCN